MNAKLEVRTLGPYRIFLAGEPVTDLTSRTAEALFIYLMDHRRPLAREVLADFFWDDRDAQRAAANLRTVLTILRKSLGDYLTITRRTVAFDHHADYWWDWETLDQELHALEPLLQADEMLDRAAMQRLETALDLVQGDFLEGFYLSESSRFEEWQTQMQSRLRRTAERGFQRLVAACLHHGEYEAGIDHADRLLMLDPYNDDAHLAMLWLLVRSGRRADALNHYHSCCSLYEEELGVGPDEAIHAAYRRLRILPNPPPRRLLLDPTPFVGRHGEAEEIADRLTQPHCRLLTLLGPGGMGKTRLAVQAARWLATHRPGLFLDGTFYAPLAHVASPSAVPGAIIDALALSVRGTSPGEILAGHLPSREMLLILDNVEHLTGSEEFAAQILHMLTHAPELKILTTSRARLNLQEEWVYDVDGMTYPQDTTPDARPDPETYAAGQLFVQQAARLQRAFRLEPDAYPALAAICRLLDGQPLGLELAAAWTRTLSCDEIAQRIEENLDFLNTSLRNVPERQRSLRAVFDYSWSLLAADERTAMQRLAVFAGPIQPAIAQAITGVSYARLAALTGHSFLRHEPDAGAFTVHDATRRYALEKLAADPVRSRDTWRAFCRYYSRWVQAQEPRLHSPDQHDAQALLTREQANIRAAWDTALEHQWWWLIHDMVHGLHWYLWRRGELREAHELFVRTAARQAEDPDAPPEAVARVRSRLADSFYWVGDYAQASTLAQDVAPLLRGLEAWVDLAWLYETMGQIAYQMGDYAAAQRAFEDALDLFRREEIIEGVAQVLSDLGNVLCDGPGDYRRARQLYDESLREYERCGDEYGQTKVTINIGALLHSLGRYAEARPYYEQGIVLCRRLDHRHTLAIVLNNMGQVQKALGDPAAARASLEESAELRRASNDLRGLSLTLMSLVGLETEEGDPGQARRNCREALQLGLQLGSPALLADLLVYVADLMAHQGASEPGLQVIQAVLRETEGSQEVHNKAQSVYERLAAQASPATDRAINEDLPHDMVAAAHAALHWLRTQSTSTLPESIESRAE